jgi:hypothetical protein
MKKKKTIPTITESELHRIIRNEVIRYLKEEEEVDKEAEKEFGDALASSMGDITSTLGKVTGEIEKLETDKEKAADVLKNEPELAKLATESMRRRKKALKEGRKKEALNELGPLFFAGIAMAVPALMQIVGKMTKTISQKMGGTGEAGEKLAHVGHHMHEKMVAMIRKGIDAALSKWKRYNELDDATKNKIAEGIQMLIVASLAVSSGAGAVDALSKGGHALAGIEGALTAVKAGEIKGFLIDLIKTTLG